MCAYESIYTKAQVTRRKLGKGKNRDRGNGEMKNFLKSRLSF